MEYFFCLSRKHDIISIIDGIIPSIGRNINYDSNDVLQVHRFLLSQQLFLSHLIQTKYSKWYLGCAWCTTRRNVLKCCKNKHVF